MPLIRLPSDGLSPPMVLVWASFSTTPVWRPVVEAMRNLAPGGRLVINAIRKQADDKDQLLKIDYPEHLWMEKEIKSVANICRRDVTEFLELAAEMKLPGRAWLEYEVRPAENGAVAVHRGW